MSNLVKFHQSALPLPNVVEKHPSKRLMGLPQSEVDLKVSDHVADDKLETCLHLPTFIQTKANLIPEAGLEGARSSLGRGLRTNEERTKNGTELLEKASGVKAYMKTTNVSHTGGHKKLPPKKNPQLKDARLGLQLAADATFEMLTDQQKDVDDCVDDSACAGSNDVRKHLYASKNDCIHLETNCDQKQKTLNCTFLVTSSLMEQDVSLLKPVDNVQNDPNNRVVNAEWGNATCQVESELAEQEGRTHAQHALGLAYTTLTDDDKLELEVLPKSNLDYYKTCYDVSFPIAKLSLTHLLNSDFKCSVVSSGNDLHQPCNINKQQKMSKGVLGCGHAEKSLSNNQTAVEQPNYHLRGIGNSHSMARYENMMLASSFNRVQSSMPSPSKAICSPSTDSALELNVTFLCTSTPKASAENASWLPGSRLQANMRSKVTVDRQSKAEKSKATREVDFSDALVDVSSRLKFDPACRSVSSARHARRDLECDGKFVPRNRKGITLSEKRNKLVKNNLSATDLLPSSSVCEKSGLEISAVKEPWSDKVLTCGEGAILDESVESISSSNEEFNELEFEFFENEDYRIKPKDVELSSYLQSFCSPRDWSIVDFNEENIASFFLTDVGNMTHLCRMSCSANSVNADNQPQSKASPGCLKKSFSSPDEFSDLSLARLPIFGADMPLKAEGSSNLKLEKHFKESRQAHAYVTQASLATAVGLNQPVKDLKKVDVFMPDTGLHIGSTCQKGCRGAKFEHPTNINRSNNNDIDQDRNRQGVSPISADHICIDSDPGYINHPRFQDASTSSDALNSVESHQMNVVQPAMHTMTTAPSTPSLSSTPGVGSDVATAAVRPVSSTRRQLPVPQVMASAALSSRVSPPKSHHPQKIQEQTNSSLDKCIMVQVEMEKQVKVEMVKQVKVSCAVQESCESRMSSAVLNKDSLMRTSASSTRSSTQSPLESFPRRSNHASKIGVPLSKASAVPSGRSSTAQPLYEQQKEKSESERSGAVSAPPVGNLYTIRKGTSRQLPNADLVKQAKQKEPVELTRRPELAKTNNVPQLRRFSVCKNKEKMCETGKLKNGSRPANLITKPTLENSGSTHSKIGKANVSVNSSASSSASSAPASQTSLKRLLRPYQVIATNQAMKHGREVHVADPGSKKTSAELKPVQPEQKLGGQNVNRAPEKNNTKALAECQKPKNMLAVRKSRNLGSGLPTAKQVPLSVVGKESVSGRRASNASICSSIKSEIIGRNNTPQDSQLPSDKKMKAITSVTSEDTISVQYPHQPDVVSNSVLRELPIKKLHLLEMQCKDMSKRLHSSAVQLKTRTAGFEAMITVVKYYVEQMTLLSENISALRSQLVSTSAKCDVLMYQRNALVSEIQGLKEDHEVEVNGMKVTHQMELHALQEKTKAVIKQVEEEHLKMAATLQLNSQQLIEDLKSEHRKELEALGQSISDTKSKHKQKLTDLQRNHENRLKELKAQFETVTSTMVEKMDQLNAECAELRLRNQALMEADPSASNSFGNQEAEKQAENLKQEIESLKVVVELRNQENGKLRKHNVALESQVEELAEAKQKILQLEQKLENTEAIVHMKSDYERELAEKHTTLLRKYNKESKVNKRLSMNNEELMWKLNQAAVAPSTSPKPIRRTLSGPPAKSAPGTPLLVRRSQPEMGSESFFLPDDSARSLEDSD